MVTEPDLFVMYYYATVETLSLGLDCVQLAHPQLVMMRLHVID